MGMQSKREYEEYTKQTKKLDETFILKVYITAF